MGVLLVEHHLPIVFDTSDHVVAIDFGQLLYSGDVPGLQRDEAVRSAYLGVVEEIGGQP
jgi:ABC-type branched-subunit amino acid transport system ATPase component